MKVTYKVIGKDSKVIKAPDLKVGDVFWTQWYGKNVVLATNNKKDMNLRICVFRIEDGSVLANKAGEVSTVENPEFEAELIGKNASINVTFEEV